MKRRKQNGGGVLSRLTTAILVLLLSFFLVACGSSAPVAELPEQPAVPNVPEQIEEITEPEPEPECEHIKGDLVKVTTGTPTVAQHDGVFTCQKCKQEYHDEIVYDDLQVPMLDVIGSIAEASKENKVKVAIKYVDKNQTFDCDATLKVQGATSASYPKKNYNLQLYKSNSNYKDKYKVKLCDGWGKQSKYCLKANYIDYSQARNVVSGQIYNQIVHSRDLNDELKNLYNGGVVDGYPVVIYLNGEYLGLYTLNIPKDKWMFGMTDDDGSDTIHQAAVMGKDWTDTVAFRESMSGDFTDGWDLEYCSTEDVDVSWVVASFNRLINFVNDSDDETFVNEIENYINLPRTIDTIVYTSFIGAYDNTSKNIVWLTYDGVTWCPSMYDLDGTWGLLWNGNIDDTIDNYLLIGNRLCDRIRNLQYDLIKTRFAELCGSILTADNINQTFADFFDKIPDLLYQAESEKWPKVPSQNANNFEQIKKFTIKRLNFVQSFNA